MTFGVEHIPRWTFGPAAMGVTAYFGCTWAEDLPTLIASLFLFLIVATDTLAGKIPNILTLPLALVAFIFHSYTTGLAGFLNSLMGLVLGLAILLVPYLLGGMGAGDVKALAALGALLGPFNTFQAFIYMCLIGGVMALLQYPLHPQLRRKTRDFFGSLKTAFLLRDKKAIEVSAFMPEKGKNAVKIPYAAAMALGYFGYFSWGRLV